jgi:hypothetical protein
MPADTSRYHHITQTDYDAVSGPDWPTYAVFQQHQNVPDFVYNEIDLMLGPQKSFDHSSFCVLPFYGWEIPFDTACCLLPIGSNLEKIRKDMLNDQRPQACYKCWHQEDSGIKSDRQLKNETVDFYFDKNIHDLLDDCQQGKNYVAHYKIDTSNTCNAACVTCGSDFSSTWTQLLEKNNQPATRNWQILPHKIDQQIDYKTAKLISFRGGEPLLSKTNFHVLEQLIEAGNCDCFISFQTNGSIIPTEHQEKILRNFKNLNFSLSIDGVGPVFEYLRYPLKWADIEKIIDWCRQRHIEISANCTVSNLNVLYLDQITAWFDKNNINYLINQVYGPVWFTPGALPDAVKQKINFEFLHTDTDQENYAMFQEKIAEQDAWKGIHMQDYLPELCQLLT